MRSIRRAIRRQSSRLRQRVGAVVTWLVAGKAATGSWAATEKKRGQAPDAGAGLSQALVWAHRGASALAPENTLAAFRLAAELGADGVELDVHRTRDGETVVCHDERIDRTSDGKGAIGEMTLAELRAFSFDNGMPGFEGERIPTLAEVYGLLAPTGLAVNVELKTDAVAYPGIEEQCLAIAQAYGMRGRVLYSSFNHASLRRILELDPEARTGLLYYKPLPCDDAAYAVREQAFAVHPHWQYCHQPGFMQSMQEAGVRVHPWTVDDPKEAVAVAKLGAAALITNKPDVVLAALGRKKPPAGGTDRPTGTSKQRREGRV